MMHTHFFYKFSPFRHLALLALIAIPRTLPAGDPSPPSIQNIHHHFQQMQPIVPWPEIQLSWEQARTIQDGLIDLLVQDWGSLAGYKAALTSKPAQQKFGVTQPVLGLLLKKMLLASPATFEAKFAAKPMVEGDLILIVGSDDINEADTPDAFFQAIESVVPFLEVPDLVFSNPSQVKGPDLAAVNAGARYGVLGPAVPIAEFNGPDALTLIKVSLQDAHGQEIASGDATAVMGHPLLAAMWIRDQLKARGERLLPGQHLSLGSLTPLLPVKPGMKVTALYRGLPIGIAAIQASFAP